MLSVVPYVGTWIEMYPEYTSLRSRLCRSLRGNVDRNRCFRITCPRLDVVPYVGTWIEISGIEKCNQLEIVSFPTWERG